MYGLAELRLFVAIATLGSISAAARQLQHLGFPGSQTGFTPGAELRHRQAPEQTAQFLFAVPVGTPGGHDAEHLRTVAVPLTQVRSLRRAWR